MTGLTAAGPLIRLVLRRDRVRISLWFVAIAVVVVASAASVVELYSTPEQIATYVGIMGENAAVVLFSGPGHGFDDPSTGVVLANEAMMFTAVAFALMSVFLVVRNTRAEEELERTELLRSAVVGRHAPLSAALVVVVSLNLALAAVLSAGLVVLDLPVGGSVAFGVAAAGAGVVFAGIAALAAQVTTTGRGALSLAGGALGLAFVLRAVGDIGNGVASWLSPIGWAQSLRPWAGERWWVAALMAATSLALVASAFALEARRDLGGGLVQQRPGRLRAPSWVANPWALSWRLQRAMVAGWLASIVILGVTYGSVATEIERMLDDSPELADFLAAVQGANVVDAYLATVLQMLAMLTLGFSLASVLRIRSEETSGRVETMLASPRPRWHWASGHLLVSVAGTVVIMALGGLGAGVGMAVAVGDHTQILRLGGAALVNLPAMVVIIGVAMALIGFAPRAALAAWGVLAGVVVIGLFGGLIRIPRWAEALSPLDHTPMAPAASVEVLPLVILTGVGVGLITAGFVGLGRRDLA